jgi:hypothetical protein
MSEAVRTAQSLAQTGDAHDGRKLRRIHFVGGWQIGKIDARRLQHLEIGGFRARIRGKVFVGCELLRVDKDRRDDPPTFAARRRDQCHVPGMQRAHRWHQPDPLTGPPPGGEALLEIGARPYHLHRGSLLGFARRI